jgi:hypothetical protein
MQQFERSWDFSRMSNHDRDRSGVARRNIEIHGRCVVGPAAPTAPSWPSCQHDARGGEDNAVKAVADAAAGAAVVAPALLRSQQQHQQHQQHQRQQHQQQQRRPRRPRSTSSNLLQPQDTAARGRRVRGWGEPERLPERPGQRQHPASHPVLPSPRRRTLPTPATGQPATCTAQVGDPPPCQTIQWPPLPAAATTGCSPPLLGDEAPAAAPPRQAAAHAAPARPPP